MFLVVMVEHRNVIKEPKRFCQSGLCECACRSKRMCGLDWDDVVVVWLKYYQVNNQVHMSNFIIYSKEFD